MAFAQNWVETDPDGSVITVSVLDNWIRFTKIAVRERMEGDATLNLTGLIESGTWSTGPVPKQGSARAWAVTAANLGTVPLQDGRMAITTDTHRMYHMAGAGYYELDYLSKVAGGTVAGAVILSAGLTGTTATFSGNVTAASFTGLPAAAAGTLTGTVLAANVVTSSLTSVGTLASLTVTAPIVGSVTGSAASCTGNAATATTAGTVTTAAQPTITSVGTLTSLTVTGALSSGAHTVTAGGITVTGASTITGTLGGVTTLTATTFVGALTGNVTGNASGSSGSCTGLAATATALATARAINGVNFDGTAPITVAAAAATLTGTTLAANVLASSLTSVGTLASLVVTGSVTAGSYFTA